MHRNQSQAARHLIPDALTLSVFTKEELQKLCVTKIFTPLTFDPLGHPVLGGLYDPNLGPWAERGDPCATCRGNFLTCPGHFGYIDLPLPVVNPLFHKMMGLILRSSCLNCYRIQVPGHLKYSLQLQMKLLKAGLVSDAVQIANKIAELITIHGELENIPEEATASLKIFQKLTKESLAKSEGDCVMNKTTETLRNEFLNEMFKQIKPRKSCLYCKRQITRIQAYRNRIVINTKRFDDPDASGNVKLRAIHSKFMTPEESRRNLQQIWNEEQDFIKEIVSLLADVSCANPTDVFFFDVVPVTPPLVRPVNMVAGRISEHLQTHAYKAIVQNAILLRLVIQVAKNDGDTDSIPEEAKSVYQVAQGTIPSEKLNYAWDALQESVNNLVDTQSTRSNTEGLKQLLEKKEGIIRMHMMGKRVNFSARSVITPDPNLNIDEIGLPEAFAKTLTFPVPVTSWNVEEMRKLIANGPDIHPGAVMVEYEDGTLKRINHRNRTQQESILKRLLTPDDKGFRGVKKVHRHLKNGDVVLLNRQPTLHKPSIMAHTVRVLKNEKTIRLHYANCKSYNADFDGDEMNVHFPQNELSRSEAYNIVTVSNQFLVPKDGTPLSGLIQDHMIAGVKLSLRGKFFNKTDYQHLIYQALSFKLGKIKLLTPAIIKPQELWSGKQIISTVIINVIPEGAELISLNSLAKIGAKAWLTGKPRKWKGGGTTFTNPNMMSEAEVVIHKGELLSGVLDKTHYGATPYGLAHCIYELYGGKYAIQLLSSLAKLFMNYLQREGFTLGVHDILVVPSADKKRQQIITESRKIGLNCVTTALDLPENTSPTLIAEENDLRNPKIRNMIDRQYKSGLDSFTNQINKTCLPAGLVSKFPQNNLQLMVQSGAKGSTVNTMQISCLLGQIELEGKRPPLMISGKSLPSFPQFEFSPRAGGFIDGRFMTGIQPQEFFFHCMAGREGLIDTACKTSRSGYLQRCLIKNLEGLSIGYDMTVRDSDKSVIQFLYGEDGMDISKVQFLNEKQMPFLAENTKAVLDQNLLKQLKVEEEQKELRNHQNQLTKWCKIFGHPLTKKRQSPFTLFSQYVRNQSDGKQLSNKKIAKMWYKSEDDVKQHFKAQCESCPMPINALYQPDVYFGSLNERLDRLLTDYTRTLSRKRQKNTVSDMFHFKAMTSMCCPGEPVGLLAAQSIGEPSTQMTLNTFHFAGRGEMNVTLGIPRLREILMMASKHIKTPSMEIPFKANLENQDECATKLQMALTRVIVSDVLEKIDVEMSLVTKPIRQHQYTLRFQFLPPDLYADKYGVKPKQIIKHLQKKFFAEMFNAIRKVCSLSTNFAFISNETNKSAKKPGVIDDDYDKDDGGGDGVRQNGGSDENSSDEEPEDTEDGKSRLKYDNAHNNQEPEAEEQQKSDDENEDEGEEPAEGASAESRDEDVVVATYHYAQDYSYDKKQYLWCQLRFALPVTMKKLDLTALLRDVASKSVIYETPNIKRAITYTKENQLYLRTDGINILEMCKYYNILDLNRLYCNDIHKMADTYGIEAAMKIIVKEVKDVFNVYGIKVDPRHLSLIADYMTFNGIFEALNRTGMGNSAAPLQQMSFESSLNFLKKSVIRGQTDQLLNPSSCLIVGKPCRSGTGCFDLLENIPIMQR